MSATIIPFPVKRSRSRESLERDPGHQLMEAIRQKILDAGGTWVPGKSDYHIQRIISLLADAKPIK